MSYIVYAIPVFFLLIGLELIVDKWKGSHYYRFNDAISNLSCGIGQQTIGKVLLGAATIVGYKYIYEHWRFWSMPSAGHGDPAWEVVLTWVVLFIGVDFFYYWFHRFAHEISFMWGAHIVHHQSEEYNLTVALRQAWLQAAFSWVFYLPLAFLGFDTGMFITIASFQTLYQFWIHTKAIKKLPAPIEYLFNTPSHHRVHHGVNPQYIDRNNGGTFIIFDRWFGTFEPEGEEVVYGITTGTDSWNPLWVNFEYWGNLFKETFKARKWIDRLKMLAFRPGWKPTELGGPVHAKPVTPQTFHKYDTEVPQGLNYYVLFHYLVLLIGSSLFLLKADNFSGGLKFLATSLIILSIVNMSGLLEGRQWAYWLETVRIVLLMCLPVPFIASTTQLAIYGFAFPFGILSSLWLYRYRGIFLEKEQNANLNRT